MIEFPQHPPAALMFVDFNPRPAQSPKQHDNAERPLVHFRKADFPNGKARNNLSYLPYFVFIHG